MQRVTRQAAAAHLHVSEATVDRMVRRGDLPTEKEPQGSRYRVWILLDEDTVTIPGDNSVYAGDGTADTSADHADNSVDTGGNGVYSNGDEVATLRTELGRIRELADYREQLLKDSEWRYHELLQQLNLSQEANVALAKALPPAIAAAVPPKPAPRRRRRWWPFGKGRN